MVSDRIRTVVIPVGGLSSRLYPLARVVSKEMMLVYDRPLIQYAIDEAARAGFERAVLVYRNPLVRQYFEPLGEEEIQLLEGKGKQKCIDLYSDVARGMKLEFVCYGQIVGSGRTLSAASEFVTEPAFAVMLPDDFLLPGDDSLAQLVAEHESRGGAWLLITRVREGKHLWGMVKSRPVCERVRQIQALVEKPEDDLPDYCYGIVGRYILPSSIFNVLDRTQADRFGEVNITNAVKKLLEEDKSIQAHGYVASGPVFDAGVPDGIAAINSFLVKNPDAAWCRPPPEIGPTPYRVPGEHSLSAVERESQHYVKGGPYPETVLDVCFTEGQGGAITDLDGNVYYDFSSTLNVPLGHANPRIAGAIARAGRSLVNAGNYTTPQRQTLVDLLEAATDDEYRGWQFYSAGTESVEAALRYARAITGRSGFVAFDGSYHGKTEGAVSLADMFPHDGQRLPGVLRVPYGYCYRCSYGNQHPACDLQCVWAIGERADYDPRQVAGVVVEPIQGEGVVVPPPEFLRGLEGLCRRHQWLLICDEVLTGLGRTGSSLASTSAGARPDIICLGKCLGNGFPISAVAVKKEHVAAVQHVIGTTTFGGNPVACSAAIETLTTYKADRVWEHVRETSSWFLDRLRSLVRHEVIGDVRGKGFLAGIEFVDDKESRAANSEACSKAAEQMFRHGVVVTRLKHILRLTPPLTVTADWINEAMDRIQEALGMIGP